jgi:hypothetical protein
VLHFSTAITTLHLTFRDIVALRNMDAGLVIRGTLQALSWIVALVTFGSRPREIVEQETNGFDDVEAALYNVQVLLKVGATDSDVFCSSNEEPPLDPLSPSLLSRLTPTPSTSSLSCSLALSSGSSLSSR